MKSNRFHLKSETRRVLDHINNNFKTPLLPPSQKKIQLVFENLVCFLENENLPCLFEYFYYLAGRMQLQECDFKLPREVYLWKEFFDEEVEAMNSIPFDERKHYWDNVKEEDMKEAYIAWAENRKKNIWREISDEIRRLNWPSEPDDGSDYDAFEGYGSWGRGEG